MFDSWYTASFCDVGENVVASTTGEDPTPNPKGTKVETAAAGMSIEANSETVREHAARTMIDSTAVLDTIR